MNFEDLLKYMVEHDASDLYLSTGAPPSVKITGKMTAIHDKKFSTGDVKLIAHDLMDEETFESFQTRPEANFALSREGVGRFRVNVFKQRAQYSMVIRLIKTEIPAFESLGLPETLKSLIMSKRGLILIVGATGSGKSTTLASLIDYRNTNSDGHIITIEDPVEFVHPHKRCIINQREVGVDTNSYQDALENTLRQAPDVILIGEIRNAETMEHALAFAETGHLCISTLHANNANQAIDRIINFFPEEKHHQVLQDLSLNLQGCVSQRLIPTRDGKRAAAIEVLLSSGLVKEHIKTGNIATLKDVMEKSEIDGMQTFDTALYRLYMEERVSLEEALRNADSANNLRLRIQLEENAKPSPTADDNESDESKSDPSPFSLEPIEEEQDSKKDKDLPY